MRITVDQAREYFAHPSQHVHGITPDTLPEGEEFEWHSDGHLCVVFHRAPYPNMWMAHFAMKPQGRGKSDASAMRILNEFWKDHEPDAIIGWTPVECKGALAFSRRIGFTTDGVLAGKVVMQNWRP